jgi:hypothetical protein
MIRKLAICLGLALAALFVVGRSSPVHAAEPPSKLVLDFAEDKFDRSRWSIDPNSPPGASISLRQQALRVMIPPGPHGRPPAAIRARFKFEGDFEVKMDYQIQALPKPTKEWINISILVEGADGKVAVIRQNHSSMGQGYGAWAQLPPPPPGRGLWAHWPTEDTHGTLRLARTGSEITFEAAGPLGEFHRIASQEFGTGRVEILEFDLMATPATTSPVDVTLDNISVTADRILGGSEGRLEPVIAPTWVILTVIIALLLFITLFRRFGTRGRTV